MVYLSKIYTKTGDDGTTALGDGRRVAKDDPRLEAYGTVDELGTMLGVLLASVDELPERELLTSIANDLFDLGADLCVPANDSAPDEALRITESHVGRIETAIDRINDRLEPLRSFVLPGGTVAAVWCHVARAVCRRAERRLVTLDRHSIVNPLALVYVNRLSDFLFVLARSCNDDGAGDVLWRPGNSVAGERPDRK